MASLVFSILPWRKLSRAFREESCKKQREEWETPKSHSVSAISQHNKGEGLHVAKYFYGNNCNIVSATELILKIYDVLLALIGHNLQLIMNDETK